MKKRPRRKPQKPPPARGRRAAGPPRAPPVQYKVVELSSVDEGALERTLNTWAAQGWTFDGVQFAMRESSKRPAMAFVLFTREGAPAPEDADAARRRLAELAGEAAPAADPYARLRQLAGEDG